MEITNPVVQEMLDDLRGGWPELWPMIRRWLDSPPCWQLVQLLSFSPGSWLAAPDLAARIRCEVADVRAALRLLLEQGIVTRLEVAEVGMTFYRLSDGERERKMIAYLQDWRQRWRAWLEAASRILGES